MDLSEPKLRDTWERAEPKPKPCGGMIEEVHDSDDSHGSDSDAQRRPCDVPYPYNDNPDEGSDDQDEDLERLDRELASLEAGDFDSDTDDAVDTPLTPKGEGGKP